MNNDTCLYKSLNFTVVYVSWCQDFVGNCIVSSNRKRKSLSEFTSDEWVELGNIEKELERICKKLFNATMYNFTCLMNNAYKDGEKPNVHFHFIPRYDGERMILNKKYVDKHFGYNFWKWANSRFKCQKDIYTKEEKNEIFELMKREWNYHE